MSNSVFPVRHPDVDAIEKQAIALADWIYDGPPAYDKLVDRLKTIMELYWYRGRDGAK